ncbi:MAG: DNA/RNA helicase domain-containing protein [Thermoplasmataceae archaeon]
MINSWSAEIRYLKGTLNGISGSIILEYRIPGSGERADVVVVSEGADKNAVVIEMKGWMKANRKDAFIYQTDQKPSYQVNPVYQLLNYIGKIRYTSSSGSEFKLDGKVVMYNVDRNTREEIIVFRSEERKLQSYLKSLISTVDADGNGHTFVNSSYRQNKALFDAIREHYQDLRNGAMEALVDKGFGLYVDQLSVYNRLVEAIEKNDGGEFLIEGGPGSGKTMIAIELLLKSLSMNKQSVLCYRNNRMVESLRKLFATIDRGLDGVIKYFSTGRPNNPGVAEKGWNTKLDLAIFDEAQRMTLENIQLAGKAARNSVFFFDERQILSKTEQGTSANFREAYPNATVMKLNGLYRNGIEYGNFVESLLNSESEFSAIRDYEIDYFDDLGEMISELKTRQTIGKTAMVASFTESKGDSKNKKSLENVRVGYPLSSGFDFYKNSGITIKWLMDPKKDYAPFWVDGQSNKLETCASVYGSQGFEADYVGVIWGRDLVRRGERFDLGENCEDSIGGANSLKRTFFKGKMDQGASEQARKLLINRYRILLNRGIKGTFVFCEDKETADYLQHTINLTRNTPKS